VLEVSPWIAVHASTELPVETVSVNGKARCVTENCFKQMIVTEFESP
jgi:hypothetical protein